MSAVPLRMCDINAQWFVLAAGYFLWTMRVFKYAAVFRWVLVVFIKYWQKERGDFVERNNKTGRRFNAGAYLTQLHIFLNLF